MRKRLLVSMNEILSGNLNGCPIPLGYSLLAKYFGSPLFDRTRTIDAGFKYEILDKIEFWPSKQLSFDEICEQVAGDIIKEAIEKKIKIQILWSGGIDSTVALIAIYNECKRNNCFELIDVLYSNESIIEYPVFFKTYVKNNLNHTLFNPPIAKHLDPEKLIITGEHGDQLFGSDKLESYVKDGSAFSYYEDVFEFIIGRYYGDKKAFRAIMDFIAPQIDASPVRIQTLFDLFWWFNFSLKWQLVSLRLPFCCGIRSRAIYDRTRHFFRDQRFQNWSLINQSLKINGDWPSYKFIAKNYIYNFTQDQKYRDSKLKERSLNKTIYGSMHWRDNLSLKEI